MKVKQLLLMAVLALLAITANAQTDVTTAYLQNADLKSLNAWTLDKSHGWTNGYTDWQTSGDVPVIEFYHSWSSNPGSSIGNAKTFNFSQKVTLPAGDYRLAVNAFYREGNGNGTNTKAYIYAGEKQQYVVGLSSAGVGAYSGSNDLFRAANAFSKGDFSNEFDFTVDAEGEIEIGFHGYIDTYCSWCILGPVKLYKYSLDEYLADYDKKVSEAQALFEKSMNATTLKELKDACVDRSTFTKSAEITAQIQVINQKITAASTSISQYTSIASYIKETITELSATGRGLFDDAVVAKYSNGTYTTAEEARAEGLNILKANPAIGTDLTSLASTSWTGQTGNVAEWACPDAVGAPERYQNGAFTGDVMTQTLSGMANGTYKVELIGAASYTSGRGFDGATGQDHAYFFANSALQSLSVEDRGSIPAGKLETAELECAVTDGVLKFGIQNITIGANWFVVDLKKITYVSESIPEEKLKLVVTDAKYSTFIAPFDVTIPEGVQAYTASAIDENNDLVLNEVTTTIPANTPVILYAETPVEKEVSGVNVAEGMNYTVGLLTGVYGTLEITSGYVLQNLANGVKFYKVGENAIKVTANHAYLNAPATAISAKEIGFTLDDIATAIQNLEVEKANGEIYNLAGQKLNKFQKGINIVGGKKILVK